MSSLDGLERIGASIIKFRSRRDLLKVLDVHRLKIGLRGRHWDIHGSRLILHGNGWLDGSWLNRIDIWDHRRDIIHDGLGSNRLGLNNINRLGFRRIDSSRSDSSSGKGIGVVWSGVSWTRMIDWSGRESTWE